MIITYNELINSKEKLLTIDRTNPFNVVGALINTFCNYDPANEELFFDMLQVLMGDMQPISNMMKQQVKDRMTQNNKYPYIGKSYFIGATPANDYTPNQPLQIEVKTNPYTDEEEGFKRLFVKSGGADSDRPVTVRLAKDGNYYVWSDSFMGLLSDIKGLESANPWA